MKDIPYINQKPMTREAALFYAARKRENARRRREDKETWASSDADLYIQQAERLERYAASLPDDAA